MRGRLGEKGARGKEKEVGKVEKRLQRESESESVGVQNDATSTITGRQKARRVGFAQPSNTKDGGREPS